MHLLKHIVANKRKQTEAKKPRHKPTNRVERDPARNTHAEIHFTQPLIFSHHNSQFMNLPLYTLTHSHTHSHTHTLTHPLAHTNVLLEGVLRRTKQ